MTDAALSNPLLAASPLPYGLPDYRAIRPEHYLPAFTEAFARHRREIDAITEFDPLTGKKTGELKSVKIYANSHYVTPGPTMKQASEAIRFELAERLKELEAGLAARGEECVELRCERERLRELVETYQLEIRLTANQDLLLCNIGSSQRAAVQEGIKKLGFEAPGETSPMARHAIACPALPTCGLAITESERILPDVLDRIDVQLQRLEINKSILVRMTGCPNGCARPYMAELALVGNGLNQYQLWLGGTPNLQRLARPYLEKLPLDKLESTIEPLLLSWKDAGGRRSFGDHIEKLGDQEVNELLSASA